MKKKKKRNEKSTTIICILIGIILSYAVSKFMGPLSAPPSDEVYNNLEKIIEPLKEDYEYREDDKLLFSLGVTSVVEKLYKDSFVIETISPENHYAEIDVVFDKHKNFTKTVWVCTQPGYRTYAIWGPKLDFAALHFSIIIIGVCIGVLIVLLIKLIRF